MVLCDIGNTTFHFKAGKKDFKISVGKSLKKLPCFKDEIYFVSVNDKGTKKFLKKYPHAVNVKDILKFNTKYKGMGIDREVVCYGRKNAIIIDAGSAITVDVVKKQNHIGGFILPGLNAYQRIFPKISRKLKFDFENEVNLDKIPLNTNNAINYAIFSSIILPIVKVYEIYKLPLVITGGNGDILAKYFKKYPVKYKKNLIFNSMKRIIKDVNIKGK